MATELSWSDSLDWAFSEPRTATLATTLADGSPHAAPVWVARDGDSNRVQHRQPTRPRGGRCARDPRVALCFDDEQPPFGFVIVRGTVELDEDPERLLHGGRPRSAGGTWARTTPTTCGRRNGVPGELLVTVTPTKVIGALDVAEQTGDPAYPEPARTDRPWAGRGARDGDLVRTTSAGDRRRGLHRQPPGGAAGPRRRPGARAGVLQLVRPLGMARLAAGRGAARRSRSCPATCATAAGWTRPWPAPTRCSTWPR